MGDRIKELRDKNPVLDFAAGFIPGVSEAQDAHDFYHAAKKGDFGGMAMASLGFVIPGVSGNWIKHGVNFVSDAVRNARRYSSRVPVYNKANAPKTLKVNDKDITEMHLNDNSEHAEHLKDDEVFKAMLQRFNAAPHGTAVRVGESLADPNHGLSSASAPLFYKMSRRWAGQGKGGYFIPEGEDALVEMNKVAQNIEAAGKQVHAPFNQDLVDKLNKEIAEINKLGYNFPEARLQAFKNPFKPHHPLYEDYQKIASKKGKLLIPNIGFLKYQKGGKNVFRKTT